MGEFIDLLISQFCIITDEKGRRYAYEVLSHLDRKLQKELRSIKVDSRFSKDFTIVFEFWRTDAGIPRYWN